MRRFLVPLLMCLVPAMAAAAPDDNAGMSAAATAFYTAYASLPHSGGIPDATGRVRYAPLLSPGLNKQIAQAAVAEARFQAKNKDSPPLIEGDLFSSLFEGISSFKVGACSGDGKTGRCTATLTYNDPKKPVTWTDIVVLVNTPAGWKVDDIAYKAGFQFGNDGTLSDTLKMVVSESN